MAARKTGASRRTTGGNRSGSRRSATGRDSAEGVDTTQLQDEPYTVDFVWDTPDRPPSGHFSPDDPLDRPLQVLKLLAVPEPYELVTLELPQPEMVEPMLYTPPLTMVVGRVSETIVVKSERIAQVTLTRQARGLSWYELGACIGAPMIAFHQDIGRVEGIIEGLLPLNETAVLRVPMLRDFQRVWLHRMEVLAAPDDQREWDPEHVAELREEEEPLLWVHWSALWTKAGVQIMQQQSGKHVVYR